MNQIEVTHFTGALKSLLKETFSSAEGHYMDGGDSLFETVATVSAAEASIPVGGRCATLAAQVKHTAFYLEVVVESVSNVDYPKADWGEIWRSTTAVDESEWQAIQNELRLRYDNAIALIDNSPAWPSQAHLAGAMALVAHSAYHLGEIRQALCTIKSS